MSFSTVIKSAPATPAPATPAESARERAIAAFKGPSTPQAATTPVNPGVPPVNNSNVSLEEYGAVQPPKAAEDRQETTNEAPATPAEATAKAAEDTSRAPNLSAQYAQLARQEKALRAAQAKFKADQASFKAAQDAQKAPAPAIYDPSKHIDREALKADPFKVLADLGLTYDQLTQQALNAPTPEQVQFQQLMSKQESKIAELEAKLAKVDKTFEENQSQSYTQALNQIRSDTRRLVNSDPAFETIKTTNSIDEVVELIEKTFKEDKDEYGNPVLLTVEEAAKLVEDEISERLYSYANRVDKIKKRFTPTQAPAATKSEEKLQTEPKQQQRPTLTNSIAASGKLSAKERAIMAGKYGPDWRQKTGT